MLLEDCVVSLECICCGGTRTEIQVREAPPDPRSPSNGRGQLARSDVTRVQLV